MTKVVQYGDVVIEIIMDNFLDWYVHAFDWLFLMLTYEQIFEDREKNIEEYFRIDIGENKVREMINENKI